MSNTEPRRGIRAYAKRIPPRTKFLQSLPVLIVSLAATAMTIVSFSALVAHGAGATVWFPAVSLPHGSTLLRIPALLGGLFYAGTAVVFGWGVWLWVRPARSREWHLEKHRRKLARHAERADRRPESR